MKNIKSKTNKTQKSTTTKSKNLPLVRQPQSSDLTHTVVSKICGLTDPFCIHARGAKYPDDSSSRTLPFTYENLVPLLSDASGNLYPQLLAQSYTYALTTNASAFVGANVTAWTNFAAQGLISNVQQYRIVSSGVRLHCVAPPLTASGTVHIRVWPLESLSNFGTVNLLSYSCTAAYDIPLQDCKDVVIIFPHSTQPRQLFYQTSGDTNVATSYTAKGYGIVTVYATGVPASTTVLQMKTVQHYELQFEDSTGLAQLATPPPASNSLILSAASSVGSKLQPVFADGMKTFARTVVERAGTYVAKYLKTAIAARFGGPGAAATAIMVD